jgi:cell division initiation protein
MEDRLKSLVDNYKKLEGTREDLLSDLRRMASDLADKVERARQSTKEFDADKHFNAVKREAKRIVHPNYYVEKPPVEEPKQVENVEKEPELESAVNHEVSTKKPQRSFFDEIN